MIKLKKLCDAVIIGKKPDTYTDELKQLINPVRGFKTMKTAYATMKGFELTKMFKKGQLNAFTYNQGLMGEIRLVERQLNTYSIWFQK